MKKYISLEVVTQNSHRSLTEWQAICEAGLVDCRYHEDRWFLAESELGRTFNAEVWQTKTPVAPRYLHPEAARPWRRALLTLLLICLALGLLGLLLFGFRA